MALGLMASAVGNGTILILITLVVLPIAAVSFARSGGAWKSLGKGPYAIEEKPPPRSAAGFAVSDAVREAEVRQMVEALAYRHERRGEAPIDVEAEVQRRLGAETWPAGEIDAELRAEVRQLVITRNQRRLRQGGPPLDVDAEVKRQIEDIS